MAPHTALAAGILLFTSVSVGCSSDTVPKATTDAASTTVPSTAVPSTTIQLDTPIIVLAADETDSMAAQLTAELVFEDGCVLLRSADQLFAAAWPTGTVWNPDERTIVLGNSVRIRVGDRIIGGGGGQPLEASRSSLDGATLTPATTGCASVSSTIWLFAVDPTSIEVREP